MAVSKELVEAVQKLRYLRIEWHLENENIQQCDGRPSVCFSRQTEVDLFSGGIHVARMRSWHWWGSAQWWEYYFGARLGSVAIFSIWCSEKKLNDDYHFLEAYYLEVVTPILKRLDKWVADLEEERKRNEDELKRKFWDM